MASMRSFLAGLALALGFPLCAAAQNAATLSGMLADPSGAAIARAEVIAQPLDGGGAVRTSTGPDGTYTLTLGPGRYRVRAAHPSFARAELELALAPGERREWSPRLVLDRLAATVVVSAQADPVDVAASPAGVTILTREEILERQAISLAPLLATTPGFALSRLGREGGLTTMFLGGGNSNFTKVLVDGTTVNEPGGLVDFSHFTLDNVAKVEVAHGASSALFGSDAMTGVVQLFTGRGTTSRPAVTLSAEGGTFATARGLAQVSGLVRRLDYSAAAGRFHTEGQGPNDRFRNTTLSGNLGWRFSETNTLRLALRSHASDAGVPGQTRYCPPNRDQHNALRNFSANLAWEFSTGSRWLHRLAGSETYIRQVFDNPAADFSFADPPFFCGDFPFTARNQFNRAGFTGQSSYVFPGGALTFGYTTEAENGSLSGFHARRNNQGGYYEARAQAGPRLVLTQGARFEANASFGFEAVQRFGAVFTLRRGGERWGATRLRGALGLGIREPRMDQSYGQDPCFPGNPALRPERSRTLSLGVEQALAGDRVRLSGEYFDHRFRDIVSFTFCFPGAPCPAAPPPGCPFGFGTFFNTDRARAYGTRLAVEARAARWLRVSGNYTYTDSRVLESPNAFDPTLVPGNRLFKRPLHAGNIVVHAGYRRMNMNVVAAFVGRRTDSDFLSFHAGGACFGPCETSNPGYARVDAGATYELRRGVTAFARVENLFDERYEDSLGYPAYRRGYRAGMRFTLGGE
jgi:outer membrane cobalamin receptor